MPCSFHESPTQIAPSPSPYPPLSGNRNGSSTGVPDEEPFRVGSTKPNLEQGPLERRKDPRETPGRYRVRPGPVGNGRGGTRGICSDRDFVPPLPRPSQCPSSSQGRTSDTPRFRVRLSWVGGLGGWERLGSRYPRVGDVSTRTRRLQVSLTTSRQWSSRTGPGVLRWECESTVEVKSGTGVETHPGPDPTPGLRFRFPIWIL